MKTAYNRLASCVVATAVLGAAEWGALGQDHAHILGAPAADPYTGGAVTVGFARDYAATCAVGRGISVPGVGTVVLRAGTPRAYRFTSGLSSGEEIGAWMRMDDAVPARRCVVVVDDQEFGVIRLVVEGGARPRDFALAKNVLPNDLDYRYDPATGELRPIGAGSTTTHNGLALLYGISDAPVVALRLESQGLSSPIDWVGFGLGLLGPARGPQFESAPQDAVARAGDEAPTVFAASACGASPVGYRWQLTTEGPAAPDDRWADLADGVIYGVGGVVAGSVSGSASPRVEFSGLTNAWWPSPVYVRCRATDDGGTTASSAAEFLVEVCPGALYFTLDPLDQPGCYDGVAEFTALAEGDPPVAYLWRKDGEDLIDGAAPSGSTIEGAATPTLRISGLQFPDAGRYECVVSNPCGFAISNPGRLEMCPGDFNCDGGIDGSDVGAFFTMWEAGMPGADVNVDGGVDGGDVSTFFGVWEAGGCYGCVRDPDVNFDGVLDCLDVQLFRQILQNGLLAADFNCDHRLDASDEPAYLASYFGAGGVVCPCEQPVDRNQDGVIDCLDVEAFLRAFLEGLPEADFNCDSVIDFFDVEAFYWAYHQAGGPDC